jgi:hypothetical protein
MTAAPALSSPSTSPSPLLRGALLGARLGFERLRDRRTAVALLLATALALAGALIERDAGSLGAVDRALAGTFRLLIPLLTLALVSRAASREGLTAGTFPLARFGLPRFSVALGVGGGGGAGGPRRAASPPLVRDMLLSAWIATATAVAYTGWTALGSTYFRGRGRWAPIAADFLIGGSSGLAGAVLPRAHAQSLLGLGPGPLLLPPSVSFVALFAMGAALALAAAARSGR